MKGYHVFDFNGIKGRWIEIELIVQLLSILYWKKHGNQIGLIANKEFINLLEEYEILALYDEVIELAPIDERIDKTRFWAMPKITAHSQIQDSEYCILDTDMFLRKMPQLSDVAFVGVHNEYHFSIEGRLVYPELSDLIQGELLEKFLPFEDYMPVNTSFLWVNDKKLIDKWSSIAIETAIELSNFPLSTKYGEMMSIEQRFLPILAKLHNKQYDVLITNRYVPQLQYKSDGTEWSPEINKGGNLIDVSKWYYHLWGFKKALDNNNLRKLILDNLLKEFKLFFESSYNKYITKFKQIN